MLSSRDSSPAAPAVSLPRHIAIIMDGNGRWAESKGRPRFAGHRAGVKAVREAVRVCRKHGIRALTLFAFSSENWRRPEREVALLMRLFMTVLSREVKLLKGNDVRLKVVGDVSGFSLDLQQRIRKAERMTADCQGMVLNVAANYGGRWDMMQAARRLAEEVKQGHLDLEQICEGTVSRYLTMADLPEVDLLVRTGGEHRISNFILWQAAYAELVFSPVLWPDFDERALEACLDEYCGRQRRFGQTSAQVTAQ
ncbi:di-trans,poly-cis-decaprenylcistransferase [Ferrimonas sediminicola]|uniref:Ditrans,polycis-undecaprenyl-diphosphate synthase ((2E,6E)-farnesyl-diphosphate specific) n=1 Tax=Ferrimonas sediminicola TaxID=2569538 RepID=A0A4U1BF63_9GAMM|nr:polyprenyl diphosphate synthase [Ferrimonas sediminicola]TKB49747.1 di-trans,poly-cis-decaprenylcistransferase [Ferrimonas sediminicola]